MSKGMRALRLKSRGDPIAAEPFVPVINPPALLFIYNRKSRSGKSAGRIAGENVNSARFIEFGLIDLKMGWGVVGRFAKMKRGRARSGARAVGAIRIENR